MTPTRSLGGVGAAVGDQLAQTVVRQRLDRREVAMRDPFLAGVLGDVVTRVYLTFYFAMFSDNLSISYAISIILAHRLFLGYSSTQY